ncbi:polysaccharide pyruvyl transferase family protein [Winogradskyella sp.]|jgi:colanic acid/amylovoran biosynthesis protein|uniref:polysaccharide pyruvyl transferase family protein n=1 Tax=Winogradskyella sp. TaxID=1883156 RepID=UPI0025F086A1|nr:polysaccharide pyruvyl transferase family protein [Winogradskyella sp.]MCT4628389.1 polysaccharide pyruvyl transferase family protein [Winogradskyella sp.]
MNIQIDNTGFNNKGAELMLCSIVDRYKNDSKINLIFNGKATFSQKASLGLLSLISLQRFKINFYNFFPKNKFKNSGVEFKENINVVFDAGGFHIGDQWIYSKTKKVDIDKKLNYYKTLKKQGTKIVFLPQAAGLFEKKLSKYYFKNVLRYADLFILRDKVSYKACVDLVGELDKLVLYPDFTNLYNPSQDSIYKEYEGKICIIPNYKMLSHTSKEKSNKYIDFMKALVLKLSEKNEDLFFLNHEGKGDLDIIININKSFNYPVVTNINANDVKYIIGKSKIVVSSRFHGVVSGLSQAVPTYCTSWSHKYEELMKDYSHNGVLNIDAYSESINKILELIDNKDSYNKCVNYLKNHGASEKKKTEEMWKKVNTIINYNE